MRDAKQRLRPLDRIDPPDVWHRATQLDPVGEVPPAPQPSLQSRVAAGVVAFAVFAGAVALGVGLFGSSTPPAPLVGPSGGSASVPAVGITVASADGNPTATLVHADEEKEGLGSSYCWEGTSMCVDVVAPTVTVDDLVPVLPNTELRVFGDAASVEVQLLRYPMEPYERLAQVTLDDGAGLLPSDRGRYVLEVTASWPDGGRTFYFGIEVSHPDGPEPSPTEPVLDPIDVATPTEGAEVASPVTIAGTADVFEATVSVEIYDATNNLIADSFATATCGSGCRGDFSVDVPYEVGGTQPGTIKVFEVSAEDGRPINVVRIPVTLTAGADDPITEAVEGVWRDADGAPLPDGTDAPTDFALAMHVYEGPDHCGWTSVSFMSLAWPLGSTTEPPGDFRQYLRDPLGVLSEYHASAFGSDGRFPDDAEPTGYHRGSWELWVAPSDADDAVYVVEGDPRSGGRWERWPRTTDIIACD